MPRGALSTRRRAWGYGGAVAAPLLAAAALKPLQPTLNLASDVSVYLVVVVAAALVGGLGHDATLPLEILDVEILDHTRRRV